MVVEGKISDPRKRRVKSKVFGKENYQGMGKAMAVNCFVKPPKTETKGLALEDLDEALKASY